MALRAEALSACNRIFVEEIARWRKASAGLAGAETGSVTFVDGDGFPREFDGVVVTVRRWVSAEI